VRRFIVTEKNPTPSSANPKEDLLSKKAERSDHSFAVWSGFGKTNRSLTVKHLYEPAPDKNATFEKGWLG
jgi:hypothetical protein